MWPDLNVFGPPPFSRTNMASDSDHLYPLRGGAHMSNVLRANVTCMPWKEP